MIFPIAGVNIAPTYLIAVGFAVGVLGGFFGVGGSFLAGPALFAAGVPMNFVVGTDLAHIVGKSIVAARKHRTLGNIDIKLGAIMVLGTIGGVETGAQFIQWLKHTARVDWVVGPTFIVVLLGIAGFMTWESVSTLRKQKRQRIRLPHSSERRLAAVAMRLRPNAGRHLIMPSPCKRRQQPRSLVISSTQR